MCCCSIDWPVGRVASTHNFCVVPSYACVYIGAWMMRASTARRGAGVSGLACDHAEVFCCSIGLGWLGTVLPLKRWLVTTLSSRWWEAISHHPTAWFRRGRDGRPERGGGLVAGARLRESTGRSREQTS